MNYTIEQIAEVLKGSVEGSAIDTKIKNLARIEDAGAGDVTFLANPKYESFIYTSKATAIIVNDTFNPSQTVKPILIKVKDAYNAFMILSSLFNKRAKLKCGISPMATISNSSEVDKAASISAYVFCGDNCKIGPHVQIYPHVFIGNNVTIGAHTVLHPGVKIYDDCHIGSHCKIHAGSIIGSDGFGFAPQSNNEYNKIEQNGNVIIEDHVEIGANTTIDRAAIGSTIIRKGVKLDNLIQIAHNVEIGENTVIAAQTGISGSVKIGKNCMIGGQVGIVGHLSIADNVKIAAQSGIQNNITKEGAIYQGSPAFEISEYRRSYVCFKKLPQYFKLFYKIKDVD